MNSSNEKEPGHVGGSIQKTGGCLSWITKKLKLVDDGATPPNWKYIGLVFLALFSSASTLTFLFPFLPEMVLTLGYSETEKGTYVGLVASSMFAGRIVGSVFWGWLADRYGRKLVLLITIALNGLFAGLFGFATNLIMAIIFRFLCGAANGTVGTAKTILYDISDNTNQALSMSMLSISWGMGMIVGPTVGGFLASPAVKWPHVFDQDGLFGQFPYLLSSMFPFVSCTLIFIVVFFKFDETFVVKSSKRKVQQLTVVESDEHKNGTNGIESHHPLLERRKSQDSLSQICQSTYSVHAETESATIMALVSDQAEKSNLVTHRHPALHSQSVQDINSNASFIESSKVSQSAFNISDGYRQNMHIISEKTNENDEPNFSATLPLNERRTLEGDMLCNGDDKHNQNNQNELENNIGDGFGSYKNDQIVSEKTDYNVSENDETLKNNVCKNAQETTIAKPEEENERVCRCVDSLFRFGCCQKFTICKLLRLYDVWATVVLYSLFSMITIAVEDIFPVFASTEVSYGGLGFSTNEIGLALGAIFLPLLLLQIKLYPFLVSKMGIRKVFLISAMVCLICCQCIPMVRLLKDTTVWLWICLLGIQIPFKIAANCCFAGTALLINNSVSQELAGQANGLAMMTTAMGRTLAPVLAGMLFTWTVTYGQEIGPPFDISFPFFIIGAMFFVTVFECLHLNPRLDKQKK